MHLTVDAVFPQIDKECGIRNDIALEADPTALLDDSCDFGVLFSVLSPGTVQRIKGQMNRLLITANHLR